MSEHEKFVSDLDAERQRRRKSMERRLVWNLTILFMVFAAGGGMFYGAVADPIELATVAYIAAGFGFGWVVRGLFS